MYRSVFFVMRCSKANFLICTNLNGVFLCVLLGAMNLAHSALAQQSYKPGIWVDPDGCQHWVMDDGVEGYMTPHVTRDGRPVCEQRSLCAELAGDQLFKTDSARLTRAAQRKLRRFFESAQNLQFVIAGHTDSRASELYNMRLSKARAAAVASVGKSIGAKILAVQAFGETQPKMSNATPAGMAANRRVEIICVS